MTPMSEFPHRPPADHPAGHVSSEADRTRWIALLVCCSALFMTLLDVSITNVALPVDQRRDRTPARRSCSGSSAATRSPSVWSRCSRVVSATTTDDG